MEEKTLREKNVNLSKINYFKLHGSINWLDVDDIGVDIDWDSFDPQNISQTVHCYTKPPMNFIITPSFLKIFRQMPLRMLWRYAEEAIQEASIIYIIGYSFPKADEMARHLLLHAGNSIVNIKVIDPLSDECTESDKREDIISMLPWNQDLEFWNSKITIIRSKFEECLMCSGLI